MDNCTCGFGGFHEPENPACERNQSRLYTDEELAEERKKMFALFEAGWSACWHHRDDPTLARDAFDTWLQEQVEEVDTVWLGERAAAPISQEEFYRREEAKMTREQKTLRDIFDEIGPVRIVGRAVNKEAKNELHKDPWMMQRIAQALDAIRHADREGLEAELDLLAFAEDVLSRYA